VILLLITLLKFYGIVSVCYQANSRFHNCDVSIKSGIIRENNPCMKAMISDKFLSIFGLSVTSF